MLVHQPKDCAGWIILNIAINDAVFFAAFQYSRQRQHRERESAIARLGRPGIEEHYHFVISAT
jgi:hypothetical protein